MKGTLMNTKHLRQSNDDRGTGRIEAFSDGVIAVAITLLILDVHVPNVQTGLLQALLKQWPTYLGYITSPTEQHTAAIIYGATLLLNGILFNSIWWYAVWKRRLVRRDLDAQAVQ